MSTDNFKRSPQDYRYISTDSLHSVTKTTTLYQIIHRLAWNTLNKTRLNENDLIRHFGNYSTDFINSVSHKPPHALLVQGLVSRSLNIQPTWSVCLSVCLFILDLIMVRWTNCYVFVFYFLLSFDFIFLFSFIFLVSCFCFNFPNKKIYEDCFSRFFYSNQNDIVVNLEKPGWL